MFTAGAVTVTVVCWPRAAFENPAGGTIVRTVDPNPVAWNDTYLMESPPANVNGSPVMVPMRGDELMMLTLTRDKPARRVPKPVEIPEMGSIKTGATWSCADPNKVAVRSVPKKMNPAGASETVATAEVKP